MFGRKRKTGIEAGRLLTIETLTEKPSVNEALMTFRLLDMGSINLSDDDFIVQERIEWVQDDKKHIRTDYIMHPKSAIIRLGDDRFIVELKGIRRIDDLFNLYMNPETSRLCFDKAPKRFLTSDGWDIYKYKDKTLLEVQSDVYKACEECHETIASYWLSDDGISRGNNGNLREIRTYRIKTPLQAILQKTGMAITEIEHPCTRSLQEILEPDYRKVSDPPKMRVVFPRDFKL